MKTTLKLVLVISIIALCSNVSAQTLKLAHINMNDLISSMPEHDSAMVKLQKEQKALEGEMENLQVEYNKKLDDYQKNEANLTELVKQARVQELTLFGQRIQTFNQSAQQQFEELNAKLYQPIYEKANKAIEAVSKEQGITYVINDQALTYKAVGAIDLLPAVKQNLGIKK